MFKKLILCITPVFLLAGCNFSFGGSGSEGEPTDTSTSVEGNEGGGKTGTQNGGGTTQGGVTNQGGGKTQGGPVIITQGGSNGGVSQGGATGGGHGGATAISKPTTVINYQEIGSKEVAAVVADFAQHEEVVLRCGTMDFSMSSIMTDQKTEEKLFVEFDLDRDFAYLNENYGYATSLGSSNHKMEGWLYVLNGKMYTVSNVDNSQKQYSAVDAQLVDFDKLLMGEVEGYLGRVPATISAEYISEIEAGAKEVGLEVSFNYGGPGNFKVEFSGDVNDKERGQYSTENIVEFQDYRLVYMKSSSKGNVKVTNSGNSESHIEPLDFHVEATLDYSSVTPHYPDLSGYKEYSASTTAISGTQAPISDVSVPTSYDSKPSYSSTARPSEPTASPTSEEDKQVAQAKEIVAAINAHKNDEVKTASFHIESTTVSGDTRSHNDSIMEFDVERKYVHTVTTGDSNFESWTYMLDNGKVYHVTHYVPSEGEEVKVYSVYEDEEAESIFTQSLSSIYANVETYQNYQITDEQIEQSIADAKEVGLELSFSSNGDGHFLMEEEGSIKEIGQYIRMVIEFTDYRLSFLEVFNSGYVYNGSNSVYQENQTKVEISYGSIKASYPNLAEYEER